MGLCPVNSTNFPRRSSDLNLNSSFRLHSHKCIWRYKNNCSERLSRSCIAAFGTGKFPNYDGYSTNATNIHTHAFGNSKHIQMLFFLSRLIFFGIYQIACNVSEFFVKIERFKNNHLVKDAARVFLNANTKFFFFWKMDAWESAQQSMHSSFVLEKQTMWFAFCGKIVAKCVAKCLKEDKRWVLYFGTKNNFW